MFFHDQITFLISKSQLKHPKSLILQNIHAL